MHHHKFVKKIYSKMIYIVVLCVCGTAVARSVMDTRNIDHRCGVEASTNPIHHNPWLVFLEYYRRGQRYETRCGGSLISSRHVVTAAHCVKRGLTKNSRLVARLGEYDLSSELDCVGDACADLPVKMKVATVTLHPHYDGKEHDIAILTLAREAPYTDTIRPVCLPSGDIDDDAILNASGWGEVSTRGVYSDIKKDLYLPYWSKEKCKHTYKNLFLPKNIICAGGERGVDTCRGDSGGPLTWGKDRTQLWGVTSTGNAVCGTKGYPGIYTSVVDHLDWIKEVIEKN